MEDNALISKMMHSTMRLIVGLKRGDMQMGPFLQGEMAVLFYLDRSNRAVLPGELSTQLEASSSRIAIALRNLEQKGYITRDVDKADRRKVLVTITPEGRRLVIDDWEAMKRKMDMVLRALGEKDAEEYIRIVGRITEIMGEHINCKQGEEG